MTTAQTSSTPAEQIEDLARKTMEELDAVAGTVPQARPAHLAQLAQVLHLAVNQAHLVERDPHAIDRDAELWRLRDPGYLRAMCDHTVDRPNNTLVLLPVVLTWLALGAAELAFVHSHESTPVSQRPSFFADWLAQPPYRGPAALSAAIVVTVLLIIFAYRRPAAAQAVADEVDRIVHGLEVSLGPPLTVLRSKLSSLTVERATRRAAAELQQAAQEFRTATTTLAQSAQIVDRLGIVVGQLANVVPTLQTQAEHLATLDERLARSAAEMRHTAEPLTTAVDTVAAAADTARDAAARSEAVLGHATSRLSQAADVARTTTEHQATLAAAQHPFAEAAGSVAKAADKLNDTVAAVRDVATSLHGAIREVNWLAMVSDGLRETTTNHLHEPQSAEVVESEPEGEPEDDDGDATRPIAGWPEKEAG
ncbi:hypothetical protein ACWGE0_43760 [Lentzea sp. NPDC054927]